MAVEEAVDFLRSVTGASWPDDRASGEVMLSGLGLTPTGPLEDQVGLSTLCGLSGCLGAANNFIFSTFEGEFAAIYFVMGSSPHPNDPHI